MSIWDDYECDGQMSLNDWLSDWTICSKFGYRIYCIRFRLLKSHIPSKKSSEKSICSLDWTRWHRINEGE